MKSCAATTLKRNPPKSFAKNSPLIMFIEPSKIPHRKLLTCEEGLVEVGIPATEHHLRMEAVGQFFNEVSVSGSIYIETDPDSYIP